MPFAANTRNPQQLKGPLFDYMEIVHPGSAFWRAALSPVFLLVLLCREGIKGENGESRKLSCALNQSGDFLGASSIQKFHRKSGLVRN